MFFDWNIYLAIFILGLILGSYLNSWMWRVSECKYVFGGRSVCVHCSRTLSWYENVPVLSFLFLRGRCRTCKKRIPADYFFVELLTAMVLTGLAFFHSETGSAVLFIRDLVFFTILLITFVYDAKHGIILSGLTWAGALFGFIINYFYLGISWSSMLIGFHIGGGFFLLQYIVSKGKWIGGGDVRLGAMMGIWLGWPNILFALFLSYIFGALMAVPLLISKKKEMSSEIPFGTFLALGTMIALFWGKQVVEWYVGLIK